jgi:EAL domain-containing protein (putative c-di-GMP-specific phosphodiesterase class I)
MQRPKYVSDAIETSPEGLHVGRYGAFTLYAAYQPIFRVTGDALHLHAYEGLIRPRLDGTPVPPRQLFDTVDDGDQLFVECMCRALHLRNYLNGIPNGCDLFINVNPAIYESIEVIEREFEFMFSILEKYGLSPDRLVCELVEEDALSNEVLARLCAKFRARGCRIALDDFGSGHSSMARFRELKPEVVKVDGTMFRDLARTAGGRGLLKSIARTFHGEATQILVEGIEEQCHLDLAIEIGASFVQGYGLAMPHVLPHDFSTAPGLRPAGQAARALVY